jgi:DNA-binding transcriptional LysR family regulator
MELAALRAFVKIVQLGSITRAAAALGTHKAQLSRGLSQLEQGLGARLLSRSTRSLSLTEIGREFYERAVGILAAVDDAQKAVQHANGEPRGVLKLTCGVEFGMIAVSGWINQFLARHPAVRVEADFTGRLVDLVHEGFDLAIRLGALPDSSLAARKLGELDYGLFAAPSYLARRGTPEDTDALAQHDAVAFSGGRHPPGWRLSAGDRHARVALRPRFVANNMFAIRDAAASGLGIAQLPRIVSGPAVRAGTLRPVLPEWSPPAVPVYAVFASARYLTPKVRSFIDLAIERMAESTGAAGAPG